jgi:hypothetical protein
LTTLILKDNKLLTPEAGKVLSGMLAVNTVLKELDVSSNNWEIWGEMMGDGPGFAKELAVGISDNGALTSLNLAQNDLGQMVPPKGWRAEDGDDQAPWIHTDGARVEEGMPEGSKPEAIIAVANAIKDMRALTSLNLSSNNLKAKGAKIVAEAIKVTKYAIAVVLAPFPSPADHWLNCCCFTAIQG